MPTLILLINQYSLTMKKCFLPLVFACTLSAVQAADFSDVLELPNFNSGKAVWIVRAGVGINGVAGSATGTQKDLWEAGDWDGKFKTTAGYDFSIGFNKSFGEHPLYWGMNLAFGMRGYKTSASWEKFGINTIGQGTDFHGKTEDVTLNSYNVQISPFTIGYKYSFLERMAVDAHFGVYASYDFAGSYKTKTTDTIISTSKYGNRNDYKENESDVKISDLDNMRKYDAGINLGIGYWFGHFNIDFTWQRGFIPVFEGGDKEIQIGSGKKAQKKEVGNYFTNNFQLTLGYAF